MWNTASDIEQWLRKHTIDEHTGRDVLSPVCNVVWSWNSGTVGLPKLKWADMPLTPDKTLWQEVDKVLELVEFAFLDNLTSAEKEAFLYRLHDLIK